MGVLMGEEANGRFLLRSRGRSRRVLRHHGVGRVEGSRVEVGRGRWTGAIEIGSRVQRLRGTSGPRHGRALSCRLTATGLVVGRRRRAGQVGLAGGTQVELEAAVAGEKNRTIAGKSGWLLLTFGTWARRARPHRRELRRFGPSGGGRKPGNSTAEGMTTRDAGTVGR